MVWLTILVFKFLHKVLSNFESLWVIVEQISKGRLFFKVVSLSVSGLYNSIISDVDKKYTRKNSYIPLSPKFFSHFLSKSFLFFYCIYKSYQFHTFDLHKRTDLAVNQSYSFAKSLIIILGRPIQYWWKRRY